MIDKELKHEAYQTCLTNNCVMRHKMNLIRSQLYFVNMNKISLKSKMTTKVFSGKW